MRSCESRPVAPALKRTLHGHSDAVRALSLSPDGVCLYSGSYDGTVCAWRVADGQLLFTLPAGSPVFCTAQSACGEYLFAGCEAGLSVWRGSRTRTLGGQSGAVRALVAPRVRRDCDVYSCGDDGCVRGWSAEAGVCELLLRPSSGERPPPPLWALAVTRDESVVYTGDEEGGICLWQAAYASCAARLAAHGGAVRALQLSRDDRQLYSAGEDKVIRRWEVADGSERAPACSLTLRGHSFSVLALVLSRDSRLLYSASFDNSLRVWSLEQGGSLLFNAPASGGDDSAAVWALALSADASELHAAASDGCIRAFRVATQAGCTLSGLSGLSSGLSSLAALFSTRAIGLPS